MTRYTRHDVLRILHLSHGQMAAWEKEELIQPDADNFYSFRHLTQLRTLREMRSAHNSGRSSTRISARSIRASVEAMQRVAGMRNALTESTMVRRGTSLAFRHDGALVDPLTRQLAFDFALAGGRQMAVVSAGRGAGERQGSEESARIQALFVRAVQLEEDAATVTEAVRGYEEILQAKPDHAPACINLGTIFYNRREFAKAEGMYRRATEADPEYALAFFDLGNVLDEMKQLPEAVRAYLRAIELVPAYADAHYNLGLAYERQGERRAALRHWMAYLKLDPIGPWGTHARKQARKILSLERLRIVSRGGRTISST